MFRDKKFILLSIFVLIVSISFTAAAKYIPSNKDTKLPPDEITYIEFEDDKYTKLYENDNLIFNYRDDRDIFAITDKRSGYTWKTGLDKAYEKEITDTCYDLPRKATDEEKIATCIPFEFEMVPQYMDIANSLISIEYFDITRTVKNASSSSKKDVTSKLGMVNGDNTHYVLDIKFSKILMDIKVHIYLTDTGLEYEIRDEEVTGENINNLHAIVISPFLGAAGGVEIPFKYNEKKREYDYAYDEPVYRPMIPGYAFVPDGSGALIRFQDFHPSIGNPLSNYVGRIYGNDYSQNTRYINSQFRYVEFKEPVLPVFGIAHGNNQAAFVAYADEGAEHMNIITTPDGGRNMNYNFAYPKFIYNVEYFQLYNRAGAGFNKLLDERNRFDVHMTYDFLSGDGSEDGLPANYVGMAKAYRKKLIEDGILSVDTQTYQDVPIRLDYVMSDVKKSIVGYEDLVMTTIKDVERQLTELYDSGIKNINSGLLGYQNGGITLAKPYNISYNKNIGSKREFKEVISNLKELGIDLSPSQDFVKVNSEQVKILGNVVKHATGRYTQMNNFDTEAPIIQFNYAKTDKSLEWLKKFIKDLNSLETNSITIEGLTNTLLTDFDDDITTREASIEKIQEGFSKLTSDYMINSSNPNMYTWKYIDRYLNVPVYNSQYIIQTDTVPFLELVLYGTMELYAPYSNFSFYTQSDILRMIDYNVYPSFALTEQPSYLLMSTNSNRFYSTEYTQYKDLLTNIYGQVNSALNNVINTEWTNRQVVANGVIVNSYANGVKIVINYTDANYAYGSKIVEPLSYMVIE